MPDSDKDGRPDLYSLFGCIVYANGIPAREFGSADLEGIRGILRDMFRANEVHPHGPYYQVKILDRVRECWVDPDGKAADHPDGWLNVEVRIQCGRGIL